MRWGRGELRTTLPSLPPLGSSHEFDAAVAAGDEARDRADWMAAAEHYRIAVEHDPRAAAIWARLGDTIKETGDPVGAEGAYRRAIALDPASADLKLQLGHALKLQGRNRDATVAYAEAAGLEPKLATAREELIHLGARDRLPDLDLRPTAMWTRVAAIGEALSDAVGAARSLAAGGTYPLAAYDRFRRDIPVRPPPGKLPDSGDLTVIVDAAVAAPFLIRETLRSLQEQSVHGWRAIVLAPERTRGHPVASFGDIDPRMTFLDPATFVLPADRRCLLVSAGVALDPQALAWLLFAADRTNAQVVFADHDHGVTDADLGPIRADPWLYGALDRAMLGSVPTPALVLADARLLARVEPVLNGGDAWRRSVLAASDGAAPHVARLLATIVELPVAARGGRPADDDDLPGRLAAVAFAPVAHPAPERDDRIAVVIPTRDGADMLARAIETMRGTARSAERLDIIVVDNRSVEPKTAEVLDDLESRGAARRHLFDRAFNWGLASNEGARASDAPVIVFANNDLEMLGSGWDDKLLDALADPMVGAVGARLLYPNRTVQHGGITFGMVPGHTEHEGRGVSAADPGPNRRLIVPRTVGGVTGAFMAVRREAFEAVGGIDTVMGVAHSDIDFCLKLRELGLTIRYLPSIEAIHYESVTRGFNSKKADVAWDEHERTDLNARWGSSMVEDPGVSPYWSRSGVPFEALREPSLLEIVRHIDRTARPFPWQPSRREAQEAAAWRPEALG